jgi:RNA polymerase sigma factor (sigma-70 family)
VYDDCFLGKENISVLLSTLTDQRLLMLDDELLWKGIMQGDKEMFKALYRKYYHSLFFVGLKEIGDGSLVMDAIQQQFLYLWEKRETIQVAENVKSYLFTSFLRKLTVDWKRSGKAVNLQVAWNNHSKEPVPTPEESLIEKDEQNHLSRLMGQHINELPARQKELIMLRFYEGLTYDEIVQKTGLTHRTVYNKIYEALKKLKLDIDKGQHSYSAALSSVLCALMASSSLIIRHL